MSWTVACFCGTVFEAPAERCPTCHTPVPDLTRGAGPQPQPASPLPVVAQQLRRARPNFG